MSSEKGGKAFRYILQSWDGTLTSTEFHITGCTFCSKWKTFNSSLPPWSWVPCQKPSSFVASRKVVDWYLSLENIGLACSCEWEHETESDNKAEEATSVSENSEPYDNATLVQSSCQEVHYYDFHILYCASYRVPVLYFRAYRRDGQLLMLNEIEKDLPNCTAKGLLEAKWTFITQEEHPYLKRPWFKLHPCGTSEWMKLLFLSSRSSADDGVVIRQYLVSWFTVVGQVVGLRLPMQMHDNLVLNTTRPIPNMTKA